MVDLSETMMVQVLEHLIQLGKADASVVVGDFCYPEHMRRLGLEVTEKKHFKLMSMDYCCHNRSIPALEFLAMFKLTQGL